MIAGDARRAAMSSNDGFITRQQRPSSSFCHRRRWIHQRLSGGARSDVSTTPPCPTRSRRGMGHLARHRPAADIESVMLMYFVGKRIKKHTRFLNCLWMASSASLMVTPLRFRAVTSSPSGKCRSIFLTGGVVSSFLSMSFSSTVLGEVLIFLESGVVCQQAVCLMSRGGACLEWRMTYHPVFCVSLAIWSSMP